MTSLNPFTWIEVKDGHEVTRRNTCGCGKEYTQWQISFRFVESLAQGRGEKCAKMFLDCIPNGWVPVFCPSCERRDLNMLGNRVHFPPLPDDRRDRGVA